MPVQSSPFELLATLRFRAGLDNVTAVTKAEVGLVGMRGDPRTLAAVQLRKFLGRLGFQALTMIRPSQLYSRVLATGATIFHGPHSASARELNECQPLLDWIDAA